MKRFWCLILVLFGIIGWTMTADAFYGDVDTDTESFTLGVAGQGDDLNASLTGVLPVKAINGWVGLYGSHQEAGDIVSARVANGRVQGAIPIGRYDLEAFIDGTHDKSRGISLSLLGGYFFRMGRYDIGDIVLSAGAGNYTENRNLDDNIGRGASDSETTFGWLAFISGKLDKTIAGDISWIIRYKPEISFAHYSVESSLTFSKRITSSTAVGATIRGLFDTNDQGGLETDLHSSYLLTVTYTPEQ